MPSRLPDQHLGVLATIAHRLPDRRAQQLVTRSGETPLTQEVYQILAGQVDGNNTARAIAMQLQCGQVRRGRN